MCGKSHICVLFIHIFVLHICVTKAHICVFVTLVIAYPLGAGNFIPAGCEEENKSLDFSKLGNHGRPGQILELWQL